MRSADACYGWDAGAHKLRCGGGLKALGPEVVKGLRFVCSDMWKPYFASYCGQGWSGFARADRFHITSHLNQAVDQVRRARARACGSKSKKAAQRLKHYALALTTPRQPGTRAGSQKLNALLDSKLATARAWN